MTLLALTVIATWPVAVGAPANCETFQVRASALGALSTLVRLNASSGGVTTVRELDYAVNALGYSASQGVAYGLASRSRHHWFHHVAHVITIDRQGVATDLGKLRDTGSVRVPWHGLDDVTAGTVSGSRFYVRDGTRLLGVDIDPASSSYLGIVHSVSLRPGWLAKSVDDFAVNPVNGRIYGVSAAGHGPGKIVSLDPASGAVTTIASPPALPGGSTYGAVMIDSGGTMYAVNNGFSHRSRLFRIALDGSSVTEVASGPPVVMTDAAGCFPVPVVVPAPRPPETPVVTTAPARPQPVVPPAPTTIAPTTSTIAPTTIAPTTIAPATSTTSAPATSQLPLPSPSVTGRDTPPQPREGLAVAPATLTKSRGLVVVLVVIIVILGAATRARTRH